MLSNFLIQDKFSEFDFDSVQEQKTHLLNKISYLQSTNQYSNELIEEIDDNNYNLYEQEINYKIFEDISSVVKKNNMIELVLDIPVDNNIISINKIKLSNKLNKYIKDIYICIEDEKIITNRDFLNSKSSESSKFTENISRDKIINCQYNKNITLHVLLSNNVINKIINKNIFVNYSFAIFKPKLKFI
jgi:hypothetical protein